MSRSPRLIQVAGLLGWVSASAGLVCCGYAIVAAAAAPAEAGEQAEPWRTSPRSFSLESDSFVLDGQRILLRSGSIHYHRVPRAYWRDRLLRLRAMGLNAIQTLVPWNWHEEKEGVFNFQGNRDLGAFLGLAHDVGLLVLLRPGPYICAEWEFGGFPAWLLRHNVTLRTYEPNFIRQVDRWWDELMPRVKPLLYLNGGPVVMVQLENEFGSYGDTSTRPSDRRYMEHLLSQARWHLGESVVLYTTDGGNEGFMSRGSLAGDQVLTLGDGGWNCKAQAMFNPPGKNPCMNTEDYSGWLTHWGEHMASTGATDYGIKAALAANHSFNIYMAHGGTNFGWMSGANGDDRSVFQPDITSYDYNAPISESGDHGLGSDGGDKFAAVREALRLYAPRGGLPPEPKSLPKKAYGLVPLVERADLLSAASLQHLAPAGPVRLPPGKLVAMEELGQNYGFVLYVAEAVRNGTVLSVEGYPRDRAQVFVNRILQGAIYRPESSLKLRIQIQRGAQLMLLVENMGRLNFGTGMFDPKGISTAVLLDGESASSAWSAWSLPLDYVEVASLNFRSVTSCASAPGPAFYRGVLVVADSDDPADTWLRPGNFTKGVMWVNGHHIGRYWQMQGPQVAFFVPAPFLKNGDNEVVLLELERAAANCAVFFHDRPDFSGVPMDLSCRLDPQEGALLQLRGCNSSLAPIQAWQLTSNGHLELGLAPEGAPGVGTSSRGALRFCLGIGPQPDTQSGCPSARLRRCDDTAGIASLSVEELRRRHGGQGRIAEKAGGQCLDVTANGVVRGKPVEWFDCAGGKVDNQGWSLQEMPNHGLQVVSSLDRTSCLTACSAPDDAREAAARDGFEGLVGKVNAEVPAEDIAGRASSRIFV